MLSLWDCRLIDVGQEGENGRQKYEREKRVEKLDRDCSKAIFLFH